MQKRSFSENCFFIWVVAALSMSSAFIIYKILTALGFFLPSQVEASEFFNAKNFIWSLLPPVFYIYLFIRSKFAKRKESFLIDIDKTAIIALVVVGSIFGVLALVGAGLWPQ